MLSECRTIWNIIWSCLITIFSCTWIAIHPNIPSPKASWFARTSRRVGITIMALIAPELVAMWALRQWIAARELRDIFRGRGWTISHGFFAIMGGFMLYDEDEPVQVLLPGDLKQQEDLGHIEIPNLTKEEVDDKSKGDLLSKGLVVLQTTWFILQCCARGVQRLPITELEVVTLAYAAVNIVTYAIWFNKPLNVQRSVRIQMKGRRSRAADERVALAERMAHRRPAIRRVLEYLYDLGFFQLLFEVILSPVAAFFAMAAGSTDNYNHPLRVCTFAGWNDKPVAFAVTFPATCVATAFGAIHFIAWSFQFSTPLEQLLWRAASVATTCLPFLVLLTMTFNQEAERLFPDTASV